MVAALAMSLSLKVKTLESIAIYRSEIDASAAAAAEAKTRTTAYHNQLMELPKGARKGGYPPFVLVVEATLDTTRLLIADKNIPIEDEITVAYTNYMEPFNRIVNPEDKIKFLLQDWRYMRFRTTWNKSKLMAEIGLAPLASTRAQALLRAWLLMFEKFYEGAQKHGIAPKNNLEMRIETVLKQLGVWKNRA